MLYLKNILRILEEYLVLDGEGRYRFNAGSKITSEVLVTLLRGAAVRPRLIISVDPVRFEIPRSFDLPRDVAAIFECAPLVPLSRFRDWLYRCRRT